MLRELAVAQRNSARPLIIQLSHPEVSADGKCDFFDSIDPSETLRVTSLLRNRMRRCEFTSLAGTAGDLATFRAPAVFDTAWHGF